MEIGVWGDSIVYGAGDHEALGWVGRLRKSFPAEDYVEVYNRGVCGDTTRDLLKRFAVELESIRPETVIFAIGVNDSLYREEKANTAVPLEAFRENMRSLIAQAKGTAKAVHIIGLTRVNESLVQPIPWSTTGKCYANDVVRAYDDALRATAEEAGANYIAVLDALTEEDLEDGLHPNAQGYEKLARRISAEVAS
jgi:lysophospholipase L1-like esterase